MNPLREQLALMGVNRAGGGFNPYAAGPKQYGIEGRPNATSGPVSPQGMQGYDQRDQEAKARRDAVLRRMKATQGGQYMSPDYLWGVQ